MPNILELYSISNLNLEDQGNWLSSQGFHSVQKRYSYYWSSTTSNLNAGNAYCLGMQLGWIITIEKDKDHDVIGPYATFSWFVIGVRSDKSGVIKLPKTGQKIKYHSGDDGDLQIGVALPENRFVDNDNGTLIDKLTGLIWEKEPSEEKFTWENAYNRIAELNRKRFAGFSDWRLPNINELNSLNNYNYQLYSYLNKNGFKRISNISYWSSSTAKNKYYAWYLRMTDSTINTALKKDYITSVLAVRGGQ